jgi:flagellar basal body-associated protein FliL
MLHNTAGKMSHKSLNISLCIAIVLMLLGLYGLLRWHQNSAEAVHEPLVPLQLSVAIAWAPFFVIVGTVIFLARRRACRKSTK